MERGLIALVGRVANWMSHVGLRRHREAFVALVVLHHSVCHLLQVLSWDVTRSLNRRLDIVVLFLMMLCLALIEVLLKHLVSNQMRQIIEVNVFGQIWALFLLRAIHSRVGLRDLLRRLLVVANVFLK